ncbi:IclR family transcriptional regulator [Salipiger sp. P9]|uniref:IclR family transcriptional regulator n=1 Tax=Salipiger pentaromativorans TaxID=2943193 RepID=UPI00215839B8|nr:IclR family transcriptional regulator [Salipiger pentaromativorans]MCR8551037.1 IclR family transcriptional regulator [Salipiger pentaromativorans]
MTAPSTPLRTGSAKSQTLERGLDILETVMANPQSTVSDIARLRGLSYSTTHRIVSVLVARGYLSTTDRNALSLGPRLLEAGFVAQRALDIVKIARPKLEALAAATGDTVHLARLEGQNVVYLDKLSSRRPMEIRTSVGSIRPAVTTGVGKALLLDWADADLRALYDSERDKIARTVDWPEWLSEMRKFSDAGVALDLGDAEPEIRCVAAPIRDGANVIVAAISVTSLQTYLRPERVEELIPMVKAVAREIGHILGNRS